MINPLADNPLITRADLQKAVRDLFAPLKPYFSPGSARVKLGFTSAHFDDHAAELEGFARPLWGLVPLAGGGGEFTDWNLYRRGLANGTDLDHPEYWGTPKDYDQRLVEMAAIGQALLMTPEHIWEPLSQTAKVNLVQWLSHINKRQIVDSNWLWFRILVNLGLRQVGVDFDEAAVNEALNRIDDFYLGDGWYSDGKTKQRDYYVPFAMHYYGLIYTRYAESYDPQRAQLYRNRSIEFANDFVHWFAADGAALPFGRSLTYRFAQGAFWSALAFADVEALPWGVIRGLTLRHLRWWAQQPIFNPDGILSIGYAYPNLNMAEQYNSPGSPYWGMKYFLHLALPESHPFWQAEELPLPHLSATKTQQHPYMIFMRNADSRHVVALTSGQYEPWIRHAGEKYAKFAYSTAFGFSVPLGRRGLTQAAADSMLAVSDDGDYYRVREKTIEEKLENDILWSRWQPMPEVEIESWLIPDPPSGHIRVHYIHNKRPIWTAEGGFALDRSGDDPICHTGEAESGDGFARTKYPSGASSIYDLIEERKGVVLRIDPNTNVLASRTVLPVLLAQYDIGEHWLACAVFGDTNLDNWDQYQNSAPRLPQILMDKITRNNTLRLSLLKRLQIDRPRNNGMDIDL